MGIGSPTGINLKQVAQASGVSRMTVSLALRNHPSLPAATRRRIQKVAQRLGYRPDPDLTGLMEKIRDRKANRLPNVIGYLTSHERRCAWKEEPTQLMYFEGAARRAEACGYRLEEFWLHEPGMSEHRLSQIIYNRGIEGVLVAPAPVTQNLFLQFHWDYVSAVELGYSLPQLALHRCCNHQFQSMMLLMRKLHEAGYREIGLAMKHDQDERVNHNWRAAYLASQSMLESCREIPILLSKNWNRQTFFRWMKQYRPKAIVTGGGSVAEWLRERKVKVPEDVGLANVNRDVGMDNMTGIDQNSLQVGATAIDSLIGLMRQSERGLPPLPRTLMVEGTYVQGSTTRMAQAEVKRPRRKGVPSRSAARSERSGKTSSPSCP